MYIINNTIVNIEKTYIYIMYISSHPHQNPLLTPCAPPPSPLLRWLAPCPRRAAGNWRGSAWSAPRRQTGGADWGVPSKGWEFRTEFKVESLESPSPSSSSSTSSSLSLSLSYILFIMGITLSIMGIIPEWEYMIYNKSSSEHCLQWEKNGMI